MKETWNIERKAQSMLSSLEERFDNLGQMRSHELESLIDSSSMVAVSIRSLALSLKEPKPLRHW